MEKFNDDYAVVFSGGGALGAWEVGAYKYITKFLGRPPRTVIGSSAGALNAAGIFANHTIEKLENLWNICPWEVYTIRLVTIILSLLPAFLSVLIIKYLLRSRYESLLNSKPLRRKIIEVLDNIESLEQAKIDFAITLTDIFKSEKHVHYWMDENRIKNKVPTVSIYERIKSKQQLVDSLMASSAIPIAFPPSVHRFLDGGVLNNNPLSVAHQLGERIIFVLVPSINVQKDAHKSKGLSNILLSLMDTYINLNFKEAICSIKIFNTVESLPKTKVCIIRPTDDFRKLNVGLLSFGKKVDTVIADGCNSAEQRLKIFDLNIEDTWF
jgi:predicted acylesterase/phospholipase RssA